MTEKRKSSFFSLAKLHTSSTKTNSVVTENTQQQHQQPSNVSSADESRKSSAPPPSPSSLKTKSSPSSSLSTTSPRSSITKYTETDIINEEEDDRETQLENKLFHSASPASTSTSHSPASPLPPSPPTAWKKNLYRKVKELGSGTFGVVKEAVDVRDHSSVAIKIIDKDKSDPASNNLIANTPTMSSSFAVQREIAVLQKVKHQNICALLDWFETRDKIYMVFEIARGGELFHRISQQGRLTESEAADCIYSITSAIAYLHSHDIVHRDLKPENILYRNKTHDPASLVLCDFGVANIVSKTSPLLTTVCGSPGYSSPEVMAGTGHAFPADIFSIGVIAYILLCGYHPFKVNHDHQKTIANVLAGRYFFHPQYWSNVSLEAKDFVVKCLAMDPKKRPTAHELLMHSWIVMNSPLAKGYNLHAQSKTNEVKSESQ